jgi:hypothetical protein
MRYLPLVLAFALAACSKGETKNPDPAAPAAPEPAEAPATQASEPQAATDSIKSKMKTAELAPETMPEVTLKEAGAPPLEPLRRSFAKGQKETMTLRVGEVIDMTGGGWERHLTPLDVRQTVELETKSVSKDGAASVALVVKSAERIEGTSDDPNTKQMDPTGVTGTYTVDARGRVSAMDLEPPGNDPRIQKPFLDSMRSKLRTMAPPFPEEPVGVGAKWTVVTEVNEFLTHLREEIKVELVAREGDVAVLKYSVVTKGERHHDWTPAQDIAVEVTANGEARIRPKKLAPGLTKAEQRIVQTATILGDGAPEEPVVQTLAHTIEIRGK